MSETHHEGRRDELAAYLLGALEPHEAAELERHLAGCEECREEMQWLRPAVQLLPESVERLDPSPAAARANRRRGALRPDSLVEALDRSSGADPPSQPPRWRPWPSSPATRSSPAGLEVAGRPSSPGSLPR